MRTTWAPPTPNAPTEPRPTWQPTGERNIEVFANGDGAFVVTGTPSENSDHNCDAMGCGSAQVHILYRFRWAP